MTMGRDGATDVVILPGRDDIPALVGTVDLYPVEEHDIGADVTRYPVESGASLTDNVVIRPKRVRLSGRVANLLPSAGNNVYEGRAADAWQTLIWLMERRERMTISTLLGDYDDMVITRLKAPVDVRTGLSLDFEVELSEILVGRVADAPLSSLRVSGEAADRTAEVDAGQRLSDPIDEIAEGAPPLAPPSPAEEQGFWSFSNLAERASVLFATASRLFGR